MSRFFSASFIKTFSKSQVAALAATVVDFGTLVVWVEVLKGYYPVGVACGAAGGAVTNFFLNRHWSFDAASGEVKTQAFRYALVSTGSLLLNTGLVFLITEKLGLYYMASKVLTALAIGFFYNYPLHRYFVYTGKTL